VEQHIKEEMRLFFQKFWSKQPKNDEQVKMRADEKAMSVNCRLVRGNISLMNGYVSTDREFEEWCKELCAPSPELVATN